MVVESVYDVNLDNILAHVARFEQGEVKAC
jgi:hypothetical protein